MIKVIGKRGKWSDNAVDYRVYHWVYDVAQFSLGMMYELGHGIPQNHTKATVVFCNE